MLIMTDKGLYCQGGDFYIDPKKGVDRAIITHAHSDHARRGSKLYYCAQSGTDLLKARLGNNINITAYPFKEKFTLGNVEITFYPAGHILGSAQVKLVQYGQVWVVSGDYKREVDGTCEPFEPVSCDVFVTEATFGTPVYKWDKTIDHGLKIYEWWKNNQDHGCNSILIAYSLGKAQRILNLLAPFAEKKIYCHPATTQLNQHYHNQGITLASSQCISTLPKDYCFDKDLILTPSSFLKSKHDFNLGKFKTAFASGWMQKDPRFYNTGFVISDHADWDDLLLTVKQSQAKYVYVQHRGAGALVRKLKSLGIKAYSDSALFPKTSNQLSLF